MRIIIAGSGGVGGYYGAMLARAGHEVLFIARGEHLAALRVRGIVVKSHTGDFHLPVNAAGNAEGFGEADLVLVCVKSYDTESSPPLYEAGVGEHTTVLSLQNGVDNEEILARRFGRARVMGGVSFIGSRVESPGVILHTSFGNIAIGELDGGVSPRGEALAAVFNEAGVTCRLSGDIRRDLYAKMVWNVGFNALCAILDCPAKVAVEFAPTRKVVEDAMREWVQVARAAGVGLEDSAVQKNVEATLKGGEVIPSLLHDRRRGRRLEIETFNGKAALMGKELGVPTPVNATLANITRFFGCGYGEPPVS